jgi:hypothetical protein
LLSDPTYLAALAAGSDRKRIQEIIREGIRRGVIRALPDPNRADLVRVVRADGLA